VRALREKYHAIKRLRDAQTSGVDHRPRAEMAALALRFPGALRELDRLPVEAIETRLRDLDAVIELGAPLPGWAPLQIRYHGLMRAALRIRRTFAGHGDAAEVRAAMVERYDAAADEPSLESLDLTAVRSILKPIRGRLTPWAQAWVAERHQVPVEEVQQAFFPA
jgi:hypothetical protein